MGVFDNLRCLYPLPTERDLKKEIFQTKTTPYQSLALYEIREDGTLWCENFEIIKNPDHTDGTKLSERYLRINNKWEFVDDFIGEIRFYTVCNSDNHFIQFSSYFVNGKLKELHLIEDKEM
ncbi:MAG TPA: hypothetical protein PLL26_02450 [Candidatus Dojkabacteria bacterium]|nr:hypothetical protein [Candidatus Dojkabacteria bacterium]